MKNDTRQLIMDTAWKHFSRYGYSQTNINDICKEIGITKGPLYYYFRDKSDLYNRVIITEMEKVRRQYAEIFTADIPVMEMLEKDMALCTAENPLIQQIDESMASGRRKDRYSKLSACVYGLKKAAFEQGIAKGELKAGSSVDDMLNFLYIFTFGIKSLENKLPVISPLGFFEKQKAIRLFLTTFREKYVD